MTRNKGRSKRAKDTKVVRTSDHRSHYVTGAIPQWTDEDLRLHFYNEILESDDGPYYISTTQIIMPKPALQRLIDTLKKAYLSEGKRSRTEITSIPFETAATVDKEVLEGEKKTPQKKVQKIRKK
ncbi:MAG: hypothetical protein R6V01_06615 [Thermoplasmatota archaeon]